MVEIRPETNVIPGFVSVLDSDEFGRSLRQFAGDAGRILARPDSTMDELAEIRRSVHVLLREAQASRSTDVHRFLLWGAVRDRG